MLIGIGNVYVIDSSNAKEGQVRFHRKNVQDDQLWSIVYGNKKEVLFINDVPRLTIKTNSHSKIPWRVEQSVASMDIQILDYYFKTVNLKLDSIRNNMIKLSQKDTHYQSVKLQYQLELSKVQHILPTLCAQVKHPMLAFFIIGKSLDYLNVKDVKKILGDALKTFKNQYILIKTKTYLDLLENENPNYKPIY